MDHTGSPGSGGADVSASEASLNCAGRRHQHSQSKCATSHPMMADIEKELGVSPLRSYCRLFQADLQFAVMP